MTTQQSNYRTGPVQVGDTIVFSGKPHVIADVDARRTLLGHPVAVAADGWGITLDADGALRIPSPDPRWCVLATGDLLSV